MEFYQTKNTVWIFSDNLFARQLDLFPGDDRTSRRRVVMIHSFSRYDFIQLETIECHINCTTLDNDDDSIMETVTLPFT